jgi:hypothetical protein
VKITQRSSLTDVCFAVCTALQRAGTIAVLAGGSAATYYAPERYQSHDADFVITMSPNPSAASSALADLGFVEQGGIYRHPDSPYTLDFPPGPLAVGDAMIREYETVRRGPELLHVLSRTDVVCDRLARFYHWADRSALRTALDVAHSGEIDLSKIEAWSKNEGAIAKFKEFSDRYLDEKRTLEREAPDLEHDLDL